MAYLKKKYSDLMGRIDKELRLPKNWHYFVKKEAEKDNFITKTEGICTCGNCKTKFKSKKKINEYEKCPKCKNEYLIKRTNYQWHIFEPRILVLLQKLDKNWVIRLFAIKTSYTRGNLEHSKAAEYGRIILREKEELDFVNNRMYCGMYGVEKVNPYEPIKKWRQYYSGNQSLPADGKVFHNNLQVLFENTQYKYSQLWTLARKEENIDIVYYLNNNLPSTELLIKMGLYKLALYPKIFNRQGCFKKRFGIDKSYYNFMKKYNIDVNELDILKLYKKKEIEGIKYLKKFRIEHLTRIAKYTTLEKFIKFVKTKNNFDMQIYFDYIGFLEDLELNINNKKYLFPDDIKKEHDKYQKQVETRKDEITKRNIEKRYKQLEKNIFSNGNYSIFPAKSIGELEDESKQQKNCVRTYANQYSKGECDLYFMRTKEHPEKSLVTVEVKEHKVVQSRIKHNEPVNRNQRNFLEKWEKEVLNAA